VSIHYAVNLSILFGEAAFLERFSLAAAAGFTAVEFWFPYEYPIERLSAELRRSDLQLVLFNLKPGNFAAGDRGLLCDPDRREEFRSAVTDALTIASRLDCARINTMIVRIRPDLPREAQRACLVENLKWAAPRARDAGVTLLIEPLNDYDNPGYFLTTSREGYAILKDVAESNLKLQFDLYHLQITEGDLSRNFLGHLADIGHVQIADVPGRHEPGTGEINYAHVLRLIENSGYRGFVSLEYKPLRSTEESLIWLPREARGTPTTFQRS